MKYVKSISYLKICVSKNRSFRLYEKHTIWVQPHKTEKSVKFISPFLIVYHANIQVRYIVDDCVRTHTVNHNYEFPHIRETHKMNQPNIVADCVRTHRVNHTYEFPHLRETHKMSQPNIVADCVRTHTVNHTYEFPHIRETHKMSQTDIVVDCVRTHILTTLMSFRIYEKHIKWVKPTLWLTATERKH